MTPKIPLNPPLKRGTLIPLFQRGERGSGLRCVRPLLAGNTIFGDLKCPK